MSRYTVVAAPQPARIVLSPFEKNWNLSIDAETRPGRPRSARGHLASRSHASGRALSRALVRSAKLSPTTRLNEPLQRPARMSSFGANSVDASERLAARRSMERRLLGFHNGAAPAHTLRGLSLKGEGHAEDHGRARSRSFRRAGRGRVS